MKAKRKAKRKVIMSGKKKRAISPVALKEGKWLIAAMKAADMGNAKLAAEMGLNTDNLVSQWRSGITPMSDLQMIKIGNILNVDAYQERPRLLEYKDAVAGGGILDGMTEAERRYVLDTVNFVRAGALSKTKLGPASQTAKPGTVHQIGSPDGGKPKNKR